MNNLIVFIKNPEKGKVKTRLAKSIGEEKALLVYKQLLEKSKSEVIRLDANRFLFYSEDVNLSDDWSNSQFIKKKQFQGDLGERIIHAFRVCFIENFDSTIIIGSDCYDLTSSIIEKAFIALKKNDLVIGPANDGGYYLLGINKPNKELFEGIDWSTEKVFDQTLQIAKNKKMTYQILEELIDLDTFEDLKKSGFPNL